jgi:hypothetical protein
MHVCVCVCKYMYIYTHTCNYVYIYTSNYVYTYVCACVYIYNIYPFKCVCVCVCKCVSVCLCVCVFVSIQSILQGRVYQASQAGARRRKKKYQTLTADARCSGGKRKKRGPGIDSGRALGPALFRKRLAEVHEPVVE